jgi:hypothetical protein
LVYALEHGDAESAQRLAVGLDHYWLFGIHSSEHRAARLEAALALPGAAGSDGAARARAQALLILGRFEYVTDPARSRSSFREAMRLFQQVGDAAGVAAGILGRGNVRLLAGDHQGCRRDCLDSLARSRACGDLQGAAWCLETIGQAALIADDPSEAVARLSEPPPISPPGRARLVPATPRSNSRWPTSCVVSGANPWMHVPGR